MLKDIIDVQTSIRAANEKKHLQDHGAYQQYAKVFEPITRTLLTLHEAQQKRQQYQQNGKKKMKNNNNNNNNKTWSRRRSRRRRRRKKRR